MRRSTLLVSMSMALLCGLTATGVANAATTHSTDASPSPSASASLSTADWSGVGVSAPIADLGSSADIAAVRATIQAALDAEVQAGATTSAAAALSDPAQLKTDLSQASKDKRVDLLNDSETPELATKNADALNSTYGENLGDDAPVAADTLNYSSASFLAGTWDGINVTGDDATAAVTGHDTYQTLDNNTRTDPDAQYHLTLQRDSNSRTGWVVASEKANLTGDQG